MGTAGVTGFFEKGVAWTQAAARRLEASRRRREARRVTREAQAGRQAAIARSWVEAELAAKVAVRSGIRAEDFLRARLARYAANLPLPLEALGIEVRMDAGEPVIRAKGRPAGALDAWTPPVHEQRELEEARAEERTLAARASGAREKLDLLLRGVADDLASGKLAANPELLAASPEQRGRPPVPPSWPVAFLRLLAAALLGAAAVRMSAPAMALAGLSADQLGLALRSQPVAAGAALLFGVAAAVSIFAFLHAAAERGLEALESASPGRRPRLLVFAGAAAVSLSAAVALAAVRPTLASPLLVLVVPLGAVFLVRQAELLSRARAEAGEHALEWDRAQAREAGERARRGEGVGRAEELLASALREHALAEQRLRALELRGAENARVAAALALRSERRTERLAETLAASLELDRYAFLRRASAQARGAAPADLRPFRSRPTPLDPTVGGPLEAAG